MLDKEMTVRMAGGIRLTGDPWTNRLPICLAETGYHSKGTGTNKYSARLFIIYKLITLDYHSVNTYLQTFSHILVITPAATTVY